jgi:hypothetical protein
MSDLFGMEVKDQAAATFNNELRFENFIVQALNSDLLRLNNPSCRREKNPSWWDWFQGNQKLDTMTELDYKQNVVYVDFFDFLVKKEIIKRKLGFLSFFAVYDYIYNVNNELIETTKLRELLKKDDPDFPKSLLCYDINYDSLSNFLKNYKYDPTDTYNYFVTNKKNPDPNIVKQPVNPNIVKQQGGNTRRSYKMKKNNKNKKSYKKNKKTKEKKTLFTRQ